MHQATFTPVLKRKRGLDKKNINIAIPRRLYLYARDRFNIPATVEKAFELALKEVGVDYAQPHDSEVWSPADPLDPKGQPITWGEARRQGLVDSKGRPNPGGVADEGDSAGSATL